MSKLPICTTFLRWPLTGPHSESHMTAHRSPKVEVLESPLDRKTQNSIGKKRLITLCDAAWNLLEMNLKHERAKGDTKKKKGWRLWGFISTPLICPCVFESSSHLPVIIWATPISRISAQSCMWDKKLSRCWKIATCNLQAIGRDNKGEIDEFQTRFRIFLIGICTLRPFDSANAISCSPWCRD